MNKSCLLIALLELQDWILKTLHYEMGENYFWLADYFVEVSIDYRDFLICIGFCAIIANGQSPLACFARSDAENRL